MSTYNDALDFIEFYLEEADKVGITEPDICFAPIDGVYELLGGFFQDANGETIGLDNEYVTEEIAFDIANYFGVPVMITAMSLEELNEILDDDGTEFYGVPT
jgi:hypothetical protein